MNGEEKVMGRRIAMLAAVGLVMSACASAPPPTPQTPSPAVSPISIALRVAPDNLGCDAMVPPYGSVTFRIDATAPEQVVALADTGASLSTFWSAGFVGGVSGELLVRDPAGSVVVRDGEVLQIPDRAWPRLAGYFVCPSSNALYVLLVDPH